MHTDLYKQRRAFFYTIFISFVIILSTLTETSAAEWQRLTQTKDHKVLVDTELEQQNTDNNIAALLLFNPRGELQRRNAASKYGYKNYVRHMEQYQVDCAERKARLEFLDILGQQDRKLTRKMGNEQSEEIIPGSVLDKVATFICPDNDDAEEDDVSENQTNDEQSESLSPDALQSIELQNRIENAQRKAAEQPDNYVAWVELGNAWYDQNSPEHAIEAYSRALKLNPKQPDALNDQGAMYTELGDFQRAISNFEKALAIDPGNLESLYNMGYIYAFELEQSERALEIWKRYLTFDDKSETAEQVRSFIQQYSETLETE